MELNDIAPQPWGELRIMPIGDIQFGSAGTDIDRLRKHIDWGMRHDVKFYGTGDYSDFLSPSNRKALRSAGLYDTAINLIEKWNEEHLDKLKNILAVTKGCWLGMHEGHHFYEYADGTTTDTRLCNFLGAKFLGTAAITRIPFVDKAAHRRIDCTIWGHHGEGSGTSNPLLPLLRVRPGFPQVDIFLMGHNTQLDARSLDVLETYGRPGHLKLRDRSQLLVACGGYMRGYQAESTNTKQVHKGRAQGSYVEKAMMMPSALGGPLITITPRKEGEYCSLDIKCSI